MDKRKINIYIRENTSKVELLGNKKIIKKLLKKRSKILKEIFRLILKTTILLNLYIRFLLCIVTKRMIENYDIEIILPTIGNKISKRIIKKVLDKVHKFDNYNLIFSKKILNVYGKDLNKLNVNILDGKNLFNAMVDKVLIYIAKQKGEKIEEKRIYILVNNLQKNIELITYISGIVKSVNIVSSNVKTFQTFADNLYYAEGVMITVSNNMRKSLKNAEIIINIDFSENEILLYNLDRNGIIINLSNSSIKLDKVFEGIVVNNLDIKEYKDNRKYEKKTYYESFLIKYDSYKEKLERIRKDNIEIEFLIGNRGKIENMEYTKIA